MNLRTLGVRLTEDEIALLNGKLSTLGYATLSDFVHSWIEDRVTSKQLTEDLANSLTERIGAVVQQKLTNSALVWPKMPISRVNSEGAPEVGFEPTCPKGAPRIL